MELGWKIGLGVRVPGRGRAAETSEERVQLLDAPVGKVEAVTGRKRAPAAVFPRVRRRVQLLDARVQKLDALRGRGGRRAADRHRRGAAPAHEAFSAAW